MVEIARLENIELREVWPNEARDFTPWLAQNLDLLGEALGIDIEPTGETEVAVGPFSLDIYARDANENRPVIIENQLEKTNHDHLGKALTYAAGFNADVVVWIVREFQDEHRQALDWLNQRTGEETGFYGVVVRAVRIGDSPPAPVFDVVARPNTFVKIRKASVDGGQPTTTQQAYFAFWPKVFDRLRDDHKLTGARTSRKTAGSILEVGFAMSFIESALLKDSVLAWLCIWMVTEVETRLFLTLCMTERSLSKRSLAKHSSGKNLTTIEYLAYPFI